MKTLIGTWVTCSVSFWSHNPGLGKDVKIEANCIACQVIDDRLMKVGSPSSERTPIVVDCSKAIGWLKPIGTDGVFTFLKENGDCDYE